MVNIKRLLCSPISINSIFNQSNFVPDTLVAALADAVSEQAKTTATGQQPAALVARGKPRELKQKLEKLKSGIM